VDWSWWPCLLGEFAIFWAMGASPWSVSDDLWERIEPLVPRRERRFRYTGHKPVPDRQVLRGVLFVLHTGIQWEHLPRSSALGPV